jgi:hypothetical protein
MYQVIFYEKTFNGTGEIEYLTEPFYVRNHRMWRGALQILELNNGSSVEVITETSETGKINHSGEWTLASSKSSDSDGIITFTANNILSWIRFKIIIRNSTGRSGAKITLSGSSFETGV